MQMLWYLMAAWGHVAFWVEFNNRTHGLGWPRRLVDGLTALSAAAFVLLPAWTLANVVTGMTAGNDLLGVYGWACIVVAIAWTAQRVAFLFDPRNDKQMRLDRVEVVDLATVADCPGALGTVAQHPWNELCRLRVEHRTHPLPGLPQSLEGLRIAHLTDLHMSGRIGRGYFEAITAILNDWQPDLVCLTGDIVERDSQLDWIASVFAPWQPPLGSYFILGNHDEKVDSQELRHRLVEAGLVDLGGKQLTIEHPSSSKILLCGDERPWFGSGPGPIDLDDEALSIALLHTPDRFDWAVRNGIQLALAGHTHGGQICFPWIGPLLCPSRHGVRYASGTFRRHGTTLHVSRGTGSLFPIRYRCPPELGLLHLTAR